MAHSHLQKANLQHRKSVPATSCDPCLTHLACLEYLQWTSNGSSTFQATHTGLHGSHIEGGASLLTHGAQGANLSVDFESLSGSSVHHSTHLKILKTGANWSQSNLAASLGSPKPAPVPWVSVVVLWAASKNLRTILQKLG